MTQVFVLLFWISLRIVLVQSPAHSARIDLLIATDGEERLSSVLQDILRSKGDLLSSSTFPPRVSLTGLGLLLQFTWVNKELPPTSHVRYILYHWDSHCRNILESGDHDLAG